MGRRILAVAMAAMTMMPAAALADTLEAQAQQKVAALAQQRGGRVEQGNKTMEWAGVGLLAGGGLLTVLSFTSLANEAGGCYIGYGVVACADEKSTNWPVLGAGIGMAAGGTVLAVMGSKSSKSVSPTLTLAPLAGHRKGITGKFTFGS